MQVRVLCNEQKTCAFAQVDLRVLICDSLLVSELVLTHTKINLHVEWKSR
jgi:hypothetical protein